MVPCGVLDIWRQEAVYSFEFWPDAAVELPKRLVFVLEHARFSVRYARVGEWDFETAREVAEAHERRVWAQNSESMPVFSSGVRSVEGCAGEAWSSTVGLEDVGTLGHVLGCDMGGGLVVTLRVEYRSPAPSDTGPEAAEAVARRIECTQNAKLKPADGELEYELGPLHILAPKGWGLFPAVDAKLKGADQTWVESHLLSFEFSNGPDAPAEWLHTPTYVDRMVLIDGVVAEGEPVHTTFPAGSASARAWAALPPPDDDDPDDVETEAVAVVQWPLGTACKITAIQEIPYAMFERARDLARLRDLALRIAASSQCRPRGGA